MSKRGKENARKGVRRVEDEKNNKESLNKGEKVEKMIERMQERKSEKGKERNEKK